LRTGEVVKVSGPLVVARGMQDAQIYDVVSVSAQNLIGEIIEMRGDMASIQVYEETSMLGPWRAGGQLRRTPFGGAGPRPD
jgi:V/A-type H+-transporting ATPase subunit A